MKVKAGTTALWAAIALNGIVSNAMAAPGGKEGGSGVLIILFLAFGALILVFQLIPGALLFASMVKGLFGKVKIERV